MYSVTVADMIISTLIFQNELISKQLATIFTHLYGVQPLPALKDFHTHPCPSIDSSYFNSKDLADVCFVIGQKIFYAHKIILISASARFKSMLSSLTDRALPEIEITDIDYQTFEVSWHCNWYNTIAIIFVLLNIIMLLMSFTMLLWQLQTRPLFLHGYIIPWYGPSCQYWLITTSMPMSMSS